VSSRGRSYRAHPKSPARFRATRFRKRLETSTGRPKRSNTGRRNGRGDLGHRDSRSWTVIGWPVETRRTGTATYAKHSILAKGGIRVLAEAADLLEIER
jgi:hypothetical protein